MRTTKSAPKRTTAPFGGPPGCLLLGTPFMDRVLPLERGPRGNVASLLLGASQRPGSDLIRKYPAYNTHRGLGVQTSSIRPGACTPDFQHFSSFWRGHATRRRGRERDGHTDSREIHALRGSKREKGVLARIIHEGS